MSAAIVAFGAISGLGRGRDAFDPGAVGAAPRVALKRDPELEQAGLTRPFAARADVVVPGGDRATALLTAALDDVLAELARVRPGHRSERVGIALGTSSGGMLSAEAFFAARDAGSSDAAAALAPHATYFAPFRQALDRAGLRESWPRTQVLAACAASTIAIGLGLRWLEADACDVVLAGGYDGVSVFVAAGFEAVRATTASAPRPFRVGRDGMSLGEGAGIVALVRADDTRGARPYGHVVGFGCSNDAVHVTAPDRTGAGLARAAARAIEDAGVAPSSVDLVSAHGTATPYNDAMESRAIATALGASGGRRPVVHAFKAALGHTLGAAGVLETLAAVDALERGLAPATAGDGPIDPDADVNVLERAERRELRAALKLSAAFGGTTAALVLAPADAPVAPRRARRSAHLVAARVVVAPDLDVIARRSVVPRDKLARADLLSRLAMTAVASLPVVPAELAGAGIVVGHALATLEVNAGFAARMRERGAARAEPRVFPATSPNIVVGECAIAFGLTGPSLSVGGSLDGGLEALDVAAELVAAGDADHVIVVGVSEVGPAARDWLAYTGSDASLATDAIAVHVASSGGVPLERARRRAGDMSLAELVKSALGVV